MDQTWISKGQKCFNLDWHLFQLCPCFIPWELMGKVYVLYRCHFLIRVPMRFVRGHCCPDAHRESARCRSLELCPVISNSLVETGWCLPLVRWHQPINYCNFFLQISWLLLGVRVWSNACWSQWGIFPLTSAWSELYLLQRSEECDACWILLGAIWPESKETESSCCKTELRKGMI